MREGAAYVANTSNDTDLKGDQLPLRIGRCDEADADAVDAAVGAGEDFEAETILFDDFTGKRDVAGDLGDEAAEGGGFVFGGEAEEAGFFAGGFFPAWIGAVNFSFAAVGPAKAVFAEVIGFR